MKQLCVGIVVVAGLALPASGQQAVYPEEGIYQLNPSKSTFRGPGAKSQIVNVGKETYTLVGFDATGKPFSIVFPTLDKADWTVSSGDRHAYLRRTNDYAN